MFAVHFYTFCLMWSTFAKNVCFDCHATLGNKCTAKSPVLAAFLVRGFNEVAHFFMRTIIKRRKAMSEELLREIHATVTKQTKEELLKHSEHLKIPIGEVIDMLLSGTSIKDPEQASALIRDYIEMITSSQNAEQLERTFFLIMGFCFNAIIETKKYNFEETLSAMVANSRTFQEYLKKSKSDET